MKARDLLWLLILIVACSDQEIDVPFPSEEESMVKLSQNSSSRSHVSAVNEMAEVETISDFGVEPSEEYHWEHIANVSPLVVDNIDLSATSIELTNDYALVTYHKRGNIHKGALEIINISNPEQPFSLGFISFPYADVNSVEIDEYQSNIIWVAGSSQKIGSALYRVEVDNNYQVLDFQRINLSKKLSSGISASANGIFVTEDYVFVSSGKSFGGIVKVDKTSLEPIYAEEFIGAKGITGNEVNGIYYYASLKVNANNEVIVKRVDTDELVLTLSLGSSSHQTVDLPHDGKYELQFSPINPAELYITNGSNGVNSINILNGQIIKSPHEDMLPKGNSNAVFVDDNFIYLANGEDGVIIAELETAESTGVIQPIFHWDLPEKPASVNFVTAKDGYVFVAKGLGGFHILKYEYVEQYKTVLPFNRFGTPIGMKTVDYCPEAISNIVTFKLPEGQNALINSPEYFENPNSSFFLETDAQVEVTFLHEGAGFKNTLGYYTYHIDNPPRSVEELEKTIIFPNSSASRSGGELIPGNTVEVLGTFPVGTVFGFYLVSYGWRNELTDGFYTQYSDWEFNENGLQQNLIFYDADCDAFVLCFEDILIPGGDKDFNDVIFQVTSTPNDAFRKTAYLQVR